ncbi:MAG: hypothetical protein ACLP0J_20385 [Solirubrobacteraceae bacterium]
MPAALTGGFRHAFLVLGAIALVALPAILALVRRDELADAVAKTAAIEPEVADATDPVAVQRRCAAGFAAQRRVRWRRGHTALRRSLRPGGSEPQRAGHCAHRNPATNPAADRPRPARGEGIRRAHRPDRGGVHGANSHDQEPPRAPGLHPNQRSGFGARCEASPIAVTRSGHGYRRIPPRTPGAHLPVMCSQLSGWSCCSRLLRCN